MRRYRGSADGIGNHVNLITFLQRIQCREGQSSLGPQRGHDQLLAACRHDCFLGFDILPNCLSWCGRRWGYASSTSIKGWIGGLFLHSVESDPEYAINQAYFFCGLLLAL